MGSIGVERQESHCLWLAAREVRIPGIRDPGTSGHKEDRSLTLGRHQMRGFDSCMVTIRQTGDTRTKDVLRRDMNSSKNLIREAVLAESSQEGVK